MSLGRSITHLLILLACVSGISSARAGMEHSLDVGHGTFSVIPEGTELQAGGQRAFNQSRISTEGTSGTASSPRAGETRKFDRVQLADSGRVAPAGRENAVKQVEKASATSPRTEVFRIGDAKAIPTLADGGFVDTPSFEDHFSSGWEEKQNSWRVASWKQNGTQMAQERCRTNPEGMLVQTVPAGEPFRGGSVQSRREFGFGRWIARVKPSAVPGLLNSIFTKDWDDLKTADDPHDGGKGEVDIEFVTHTFGDARGGVHLAIHLKNHSPLWQLDYPLDFDPSADFHEWGFDILPDRVVWHVDGKVLHTWRYTEQYSISPNYEFFLNSWTQKKWLKGPPAKDGEYHVDWVRFYPLKTT